MKEIITLTDLNPFKMYTFYLRHVQYGNLSKEFQTKEGVPSNVKNLIAESSSSTQIFIKWEEPEEPNGKVTYRIRYKMLKKLDCSVTSTEYKMLQVRKTEKALNKLEPYAVYKIEVCAQTNASAGSYSSVQRETKSADSLAENEFPKITLKKISSNNVIVNLEPAKCENIQGPIYLKFLAECQLCDQKIHNNITMTYYTNISVYPIRDLQPYTSYQLIIKASRNIKDWSLHQRKNFTTQPSVPNKTDELYVMSKDESSISLRWKPPFPPTGILAGYRIKYGDNNNLESNITKCKLWPEYHCATIRNLKKNTNYVIELYARNEIPSDYSRIIKSRRITTKTDEPMPPYDLVTTWTENNDLNISWKHPNETNGKVTHFTVNIQGGENTELPVEIKSEMDYNLTYTYLINKENFTKPCRKYEVSVTIYNERYSKKSDVIKQYSPPPVPDISDSTLTITNDTNHTIYIDIPELTDNGQYVKDCNKTFYILYSSSPDKESVIEDINIFETAIKDNSLHQPNFNNVKLFVKRSQKDLSQPYQEMIDIDKSGGKIYRLYLYFVNECFGKVELKKIEKNPFSDPESSNNGIYALILLILLVPLIAYLYIYKMKKKQTTEKSLISVLKPRRKKDIEEVPLNENEPPKTNMMKTPVKQKTMLPIPSSYVMKTKFSQPIKIIDFEPYVKRAIETGELEKQHENFPRGQTKPWDYGALKVNKPKNRYNNLIAYDHTRVKLEKIHGNEHSDYINANYIDGYRVPKAYIATQGPKSATLNDFWRMIWQEDVRHIVMLANIQEGGKKKVEKYWPSINEETDFTGIRVQYVSSKVYANYEHRVFKVHKKNEQREVSQLHFTTWPDHGVPLYSQSLVPFLQQMLKIPNNPQSPVVVHCSAGVGRTGTIILCEICLRMAAGEGSIDFLANLEHLRSQRPNMVDNVEQYKLAHLVVLECLFGMHTSIPCDDNMNKAIKKILFSDGITNQLKYLSDTEWQDRAMDTVWNKEDVLIYPEKNRFRDIIPDKNYRICLKYYPPTDESSSYINAVQVDGFRSPGRFIVSQQPLPNTVGDFWRMVWERQSTVIISLNEINPNDDSSCRFWPEKGAEITPVDYLKVRWVNTKVLEPYRIITVEAINRKESEGMEINIIAMRNWAPNELLPTSKEDFLLLWEESDVLSRKSDTVIVTCYDGATASGLYIATTFLIDKIKLEQECDVCLAVRSIRHNRKQFVTSEEQFIFLYRVAMMYIEGFQSYANFS